MTPTFDLHDKVVLLTGASSGLGERFARVLREQGTTVHVAARRVDRLQTLAAETGVVPWPCDVSDPDQCVHLVRQVHESTGHIDVLINNAGYGGSVPAEQQTAAAFRQMLDVNLVAPFILSKQVVHLATDADRSISIINVASILGLVGIGKVPNAAYAASKGGLVNMTRELAAQWARRNVRVNALAPGWFESEATVDLFSQESGQEWLRRSTPMGRGGEPHELDGALLFLASSASTFMTGQIVVVDGGWTAV